MNKPKDGKETLQKQISRIIEQIQSIQKNIQGSKQPASQFEIEALKKLGSDYQKIIEQLEQSTTKN